MSGIPLKAADYGAAEIETGELGGGSGRFPDIGIGSITLFEKNCRLIGDDHLFDIVDNHALFPHLRLRVPGELASVPVYIFLNN